MKTTFKTIAKVCGISIGTVDRALNNRAGINRQTKEKILRVADELGYRPHLIARSLVKGKSMMIGVVVLDLENHFFAELVNSIVIRAKEAGYFVNLTLTNKDLVKEKECLNHLAGMNVDGIIIFPVNSGKEFEQYLKSLNIPIVTVGNRISKSWPFIGIKDRKAIIDAVNYIIKKGYRRIIYVSPPLANRGKINIYEVEQRYLGYKEAINNIKEIGNSVIIKDKEFIKELDDLSFDGQEKTAILCSSDIYALEILNYLKDRRINISDKVGLMGFDNIDMLKYVRPPLTTVAYPIENMGIKAVDCLVRQIKGNDYSKVLLLDHRIVVGESI